MTDTIRNFIDGELVESAATDFIDLVDPVTGEVDGRSPVSTPDEVDRAYAAAARASESWKRLTPGRRQAYLLDLATAVAERRDEISEVQARDTGQPVRYIASEEVDQGVDQLRFFAGAARLLEGKSAGEYLEGHTSSIRREPIGVVGQVTPWNYPFAMAIWKIAPALAAGNTIVLKPSDTTPRSTVLLAEIAGAILPPGVLNVVNGDASTGRLLVEHPTPGLVAITGSVRRRHRGRVVGREEPQARAPRARRQGARRGDARRRPAPRGGAHRGRGLLQLRPGLHGRDPRHRAREHPRRARRAARHGGRGHASRPAVGRRGRLRPAQQRRPLRQGGGVPRRPARPRESSAPVASATATRATSSRRPS